MHARLVIGRYVAIGWLLLAAIPSHADPATAPFASAQLTYADTALARAEAARSGGDYRLAGRLAAMAELDARLAWSMSESAYGRRRAAEVFRAAILLRKELVLR